MSDNYDLIRALIDNRYDILGPKDTAAKDTHTKKIPQEQPARIKFKILENWKGPVVMVSSLKLPLV